MSDHVTHSPVGNVLAVVRKFGAIGPLVSLVILVVLLSFLSPYFLEVNNLFNVFQQIAVLAIIALGATMVIISGGIDLSVGSVAALSGMLAGVAFGQWGIPMGVALPLAIVVGAVAGFANGAAIVFGKVPPFVATLAMLCVSPRASTSSAGTGGRATTRSSRTVATVAFPAMSAVDA